MRISKMIEELQRKLAEEGDLDIVAYSPEVGAFYSLSWDDLMTAEEFGEDSGDYEDALILITQ